MRIPIATSIGIPEHLASGLLPAGIHQATAGELITRFDGRGTGGAVGARRAQLMDSLAEMLERVRPAGVESVLLGGSFITTKAAPGDIDALWERTAHTKRFEINHLVRETDWLNGAIMLKEAERRVTGISLRDAMWSADPAFREFLGFARTGEAAGLVRVQVDDVIRAVRALR